MSQMPLTLVLLSLLAQLQQQDLTQQSESDFEAEYKRSDFTMPWEDSQPVYAEVRAAQMQLRPRGLSPQQKADKLFGFLKRSGEDFTLAELQLKAHQGKRHDWAQQTAHGAGSENAADCWASTLREAREKRAWNFMGFLASKAGSFN
jgi:hypothetical protein